MYLTEIFSNSSISCCLWDAFGVQLRKRGDELNQIGFSSEPFSIHVVRLHPPPKDELSGLNYESIFIGWNRRSSLRRETEC